MTRCFECNDQITWNKHSSLCEPCFDGKLKASIEEREVVLQVDIDHPSNEYF